MSNAATPESDGLHHEVHPRRKQWSRGVRPFVSFFAGGLLGGLIWAFSMSATGHAEPWDAGGSYYVGCLVVAGCVSTLIYPRSLLYGTVGIWLGQIAYTSFVAIPSDAVVMPAFLAVTLFGVIPAFFGGLIAYFAGKILNPNDLADERNSPQSNRQ
jgi:hypothetical protein